MLNKIILLINFITIASLINTQSLYLRFTPDYHVFFGTYQDKTLLKTPDNQIIPELGSRFGNIHFGGVFYGGTLDVVKYKNSLFGLTLNQGLSTIFSGAYYYNTPNVLYPENPIIRGGFKNSSSFQCVQFGLHYTHLFKEKKHFQSTLTINGLFQQNNYGDQVEFDDYYALKDGYFIQDELIDTLKYRKKKSFCMQLRYDIYILSKRKRPIIGMYFSYQQGFRIMAEGYFHYFHVPLDFEYISNPTSKSSGFYFGITKPIVIYDKYRNREK